MSTENQEWNPEDDAPIPAELMTTYEADENEQVQTYSEEQAVVGTISEFLNIEGSEFGNQIYKSLKDGNSDPIKTLLMIKKMQHVHEYFLGSDKGRTNPEAKAWFKDQIIAMIGKEGYKAYGATITIEAVGGATTMDYKDCGDIYLNRLYELDKELKALIKERQDYIKTNIPAESNTQLGVRSIKEILTEIPRITFDTLITPEIINISPPVKFSKEGIVVRFARRKK